MVFKKLWKISVITKPTYKEGSQNIHVSQVYIHFHLCRGWYFTQPYNFATLQYSDTFLQFFWKTTSAHTSNSYLNGLWGLPRHDRIIQIRFMFNQEPNSPQCHMTLAGRGSTGGYGNATSWRIWLETLVLWSALQKTKMSVWFTG